MLNHFLKIATIGFITSLSLVANSKTAQAFDFKFQQNFSDGTSVDGILTVKDTAIPTNNLSQSDLTDWQISFDSNGAGGDVTFLGGTKFGTSNSNIATFVSDIDVSTTEMDFSNVAFLSTLQVNLDGGGFGFYQYAPNSFLANERFSVQDSLGTTRINGSLPASSTSFTAVPFGVSADLGIAILAGFWGVSRLRKAIESS